MTNDIFNPEINSATKTILKDAGSFITGTDEILASCRPERRAAVWDRGFRAAF
jgi:hypothetical protein